MCFFLLEEFCPIKRTKRRVTSFSLKNILRLLLHSLKFNLPLIVPEELMNFKLSTISGNKDYVIVFKNYVERQFGPKFNLQILKSLKFRLFQMFSFFHTRKNSKNINCCLP